jgi:CHAT domain
LEKVSPTLFRDYTELRQRLSSLNFTIGELDGSIPPSDMVPREYQWGEVDQVSMRSEIIDKLEKVEARIRQLPGYREFQLLPSPSYFTTLASFGPIVCFHVTRDRSDAFVVTSREIKVIQLAELEFSELESNLRLLLGNERITSGSDSSIHKRNKRVRRMLGWLWRVAVCPVLKGLNLLLSERSERLPRIWWVTSGLMGLTPLHAAGQKWGRSMENTASHVVSSYVPTFKALEYARQANLKSTHEGSQRFLIITMPKTTGKPDLEVTREVHAIKENIKGPRFPVPEVLDTPSKDDVLLTLPYGEFVHFACHGNSDLTNPSNSHLLLADGPKNQPDYLTVRDLAATSLNAARMVFLSACSTAKNNSLELLDEVIHLSSAFLLVGFPNVIGTLWAANDEFANDLCQIFYEELARREEELKSEDGQSACAYALHDALNVLRNGEVRGWTGRGTSDNVIGWAPFIHLGC